MRTVWPPAPAARPPVPVKVRSGPAAETLKLVAPPTTSAETMAVSIASDPTAIEPRSARPAIVGAPNRSADLRLALDVTRGHRVDGDIAAGESHGKALAAVLGREGGAGRGGAGRVDEGHRGKRLQVRRLDVEGAGEKAVVGLRHRAR